MDYLCKSIHVKKEKVIWQDQLKKTPILFGEDAKRFLASMQNVKPASQQEKQRVKAAYEKLKKIATFMM